MLVDFLTKLDPGTGETLTWQRHGANAIDKGAGAGDHGSGEALHVTFNVVVAPVCADLGATLDLQVIETHLPIPASTTTTSTSLPAATNVLTVAAAQDWPTGTPVVITGGAGAAAAVRGQTFYVIRITSTTYRLAVSVLAALAGAGIDIATDATGTLTVVSNPNGLVADLSTASVIFNTTANTVTLASHGLQTGQPIRLFWTGTLAITGVVTGQLVYAVRVDANTFKVATTLALAIAGTGAAITADTNAITTLYVEPWVVGSSGPIPVGMLTIGSVVPVRVNQKFDIGIQSGAAAYSRSVGRYLQTRFVPRAGGALKSATVTAEIDDELMTWTAHGLKTGDRIVLIGGTGAPEWIRGIEYFAIPISADTLKVAATRALALAGTGIAITTTDGADIVVWAEVAPYDATCTAGKFLAELTRGVQDGRRHYRSAYEVA